MKAAMISLCIAVLAVAVIAGTTDDRVPDQKYLDYAKGFAPYTAKLKAPCGKRTCEATATLIADHWALTAAHVVEGSESVRLIVGDKTWNIDRVVQHPEFSDEAMGKHDIALLHSEEPFGLDYYPPLATGQESAGQVVSIAGYGVHGTMADGHGFADGRLRAGTNHIERFEGSLIVCNASPGRSGMEFCISPGDSGGPLFCGGKLCGVNCITMAPKGPLKSKAGEESGHVRVWLYRDWIDEVTR